MYAITGVTGHVGSVAARELLHRNAPVRAVVRDAHKREAWVAQGAEVAVADFADRAALAQALSGSRGAFILLPTIPTAGDAEHRRLADSIAGAVGDSGIAHVVLLSSIGADLPEGTGPIRWLHHLEDRLHQTGVLLTAIRSPHFQEKVETILGAALEAGLYPVFGETADVPTPMIATRDIGKAVAESLLAPPIGQRSHRPGRTRIHGARSRRRTSRYPREAPPGRYDSTRGLGRRNGRRRPPGTVRPRARGSLRCGTVQSLPGLR